MNWTVANQTEKYFFTSESYRNCETWCLAVICHPLRERRVVTNWAVQLIWDCCSTDTGGNYQFLASKGFYLHCSYGWWIEPDYHTLLRRWWCPHQSGISTSCLCLLPRSAFLASQQLLDESSVPHTQSPSHRLLLVPLQIGPSHESQTLQTLSVFYGTVN